VKYRIKNVIALKAAAKERNEIKSSKRREIKRRNLKRNESGIGWRHMARHRRHQAA